MFIKLQHKDGKEEMHQAISYYSNFLADNKMDLNIRTKENGWEEKHIEDLENTNVWIMNDSGKTIDRF